MIEVKGVRKWIQNGARRVEGGKSVKRGVPPEMPVGIASHVTP